MRKTLLGAAVLITILSGAEDSLFAGEKTYTSHTTTEVVVLQQEDRVPAEAKKIKTIAVGGQNSQACSYYEVLEAAKELARASEANLVKIDEYDERSGSNYCDRIKATLYKVDDTHPYEKEISWSRNRKLSWNDFRGPIPGDAQDETAAATYCGIGFETNTITAKNNNLKIHVYNTFYTGNSWAKAEEMNDDVLAHEQGHFDLCELYTRKLRERMNKAQVNVHNMQSVLRSVYDAVQREYKMKQELYENETEHGVNLPEQQKWIRTLEKELSATEQWSAS